MRKAAFTIVKNEKHYLPIWLRYYSKYFNTEDIYILNNGNELLLDKYNVIDKKSEFSFDVEFLKNAVEKFQAELLQSYDLVLFAECDEIVYSKHGDYEKHVKNKPAAKCFGIDVVHDKDTEADIDWKSYPILAQRQWWVKNNRLNKPLLTTVPLKYEAGFHNSNIGLQPDPDLLLIHLRRIDYSYALDRLKTRMGWTRPLGQSLNTVHQWSTNNLPKFDLWFCGDISRARRIPDEYRQIC